MIEEALYFFVIRASIGDILMLSTFLGLLPTLIKYAIFGVFLMICLFSFTALLNKLDRLICNLLSNASDFFFKAIFGDDKDLTTNKVKEINVESEVSSMRDNFSVWAILNFFVWEHKVSTKIKSLIISVSFVLGRTSFFQKRSKFFFRLFLTILWFKHKLKKRTILTV